MTPSRFLQPRRFGFSAALLGLILCMAGDSTALELTCDDDLDNDGDGDIDCLDFDCNLVAGCEFSVELTCNDCFDNDGDGDIDCLEDADCPFIDPDGDGVDQCVDNCSAEFNPLQYDPDSDLFGNVCDTDWTNSGLVGFADFGLWALAFSTPCPNEFCVQEPHTGVVGFADFGQWALDFGGPSPCPTGYGPTCP